MQDLEAIIYDGIEYLVGMLGQFCLKLFNTFSNIIFNIIEELSPNFKSIGIDFFNVLDSKMSSMSVLSFDLVFWAIGLLIVAFIFKPIFSFILSILDIT